MIIRKVDAGCDVPSRLEIALGENEKSYAKRLLLANLSHMFANTRKTKEA